MPFLIPIIGTLAGGAFVLGSRLFDKKDGTVTVATQGKDVSIDPVTLAVLAGAAWFFFIRKA